MSERLTGTLPGHFDEAKLSKVTHRHPGAVLSDAAAKFSKNSRPVFVTRHIDKVDDDDAAQIPKPQLPGAASRFVLKTVSPKSFFPTKPPVFTSIVDIASV